LREAALRADLPVGWDLVIAAREGTATMPFGELVTQLRKGLARLRVNAGVGEKPN
jgi:RNase P protein component